MYSYFTACTLDGFLADENDSLAWLLEQPMDEGGPFGIEQFMDSVAVVVMGRTTYEWVVDHLRGSGESWPYAGQRTYVFSHRNVDPIDPSITAVAGDPAQHRAEFERIAGGRGIWVTGGGDLAAQFARAGMLDEMVISYAPATVGSGRPLFTHPWDFELLEWARNGAFLIGRYRVLGSRA